MIATVASDRVSACVLQGPGDRLGARREDDRLLQRRVPQLRRRERQDGEAILRTDMHCDCVRLSDTQREYI